MAEIRHYIRTVPDAATSDELSERVFIGPAECCDCARRLSGPLTGDEMEGTIG
jgi:hypothetical protein